MKTSEFARAAGVTEKTIRYYDKIGLLKPSSISQNGYRNYTEQDLIRLQEILLYKQLDFSLAEISTLILDKGSKLKTYRFQRELVRKKIQSLRNLEEALKCVEGQIQNNQNLGLENASRLIKLSYLVSQASENYKDSSYLRERIFLHELYSQNPIPWFQWLLNHIEFTGKRRILEIGCGNGELWRYCNKQIIRNREVFLTDKSEGMVEEVREKLGRDFNCLYTDCMHIPFKDNYFDMVIANHVLFYLDDLNKGIKEICRVLNKDGTCYCTTYGIEHMKEITELCKQFNSDIYLSDISLAQVFGAENGMFILSRYFDNVQMHLYPDELIVEKSEDLIQYILSCHGNQNELLLPVLGQFRDFIERKIKTDGPMHITKKAVLFVCKNPIDG